MRNRQALLRGILALAIVAGMVGVAGCSRPTAAPGQATAAPPGGAPPGGPFGGPGPAATEGLREGDPGYPGPAAATPTQAAYPGQAETEEAWRTGAGGGAAAAGTEAPTATP